MLLERRSSGLARSGISGGTTGIGLNRPSVPSFSVGTAAKLLVMENARKGAAMDEMPKACAFLVLRKTAVESEVIGFLARKHLSAEWQAAVNGLDYAELMKAGQ